MYTVLLNLVYLTAISYMVTIDEDIWAAVILVLLIVISSVWATVTREAQNAGFRGVN